jgi:hypothetical protein
MAKTNPRQFHLQAVHFFRKTVNYNDTGVSTGIFMGTLPSGALIVDVVADVRTAFNAGSGNSLSVGVTSTAYTDIMATADVTLATTGGYRGAILAAADRMATDTDLYVRYTQTGSTASAGVVDVAVMFLPNNDG